MTKRELKAIINEVMVTEGNWLPTEYKGKYDKGLVSKVASDIGYSPEIAYAWIVDLLEDINDHKMAKKINNIFYKDLN